MNKINKLLDLCQISNTFFFVQNKSYQQKQDKILPGCCRLSDYVASSFLRPTDFRKCNQPLKSEGNSFYTLGGSVGRAAAASGRGLLGPDWAGLRRQWCRRTVCQQNPKNFSRNSIHEFARFFYISSFSMSSWLLYTLKIVL